MRYLAEPERLGQIYGGFAYFTAAATAVEDTPVWVMPASGLATRPKMITALKSATATMALDKVVIGFPLLESETHLFEARINPRTESLNP